MRVTFMIRVRRVTLPGLLAALAVALAAASALAQVSPSKLASEGGARWIATGSLNVPRSDHTATLLRDGRVLVAGGHSIVTDLHAINSGDDMVEDTAEVYDPATGRWTITGRMNHARSGHTATLLPNGKVLVAGGFQSFGDPGAFGDTAELYDPATGSWTATGRMAASRAWHTATLLRSGQVLVAEGSSDALTACEVFDPTTGTWSRTGSLSEGHEGAPATTLPNGKVLVAGGSNDLDSLIGTDTVELYDPDTGTWARGDSLPSPRASHIATLLLDGSVMVVGGIGGMRTAILYDPTTGAWSSPIWRPAGVILNSATLLSDGSVLIAGGSGNDGRELGSTEIFDPAGRQWSAAAGMSVARMSHTATLLQDGRVLVAGGRSQALGPLANAELYGRVPPGTLAPGYTGSWFDPAQSGHGLHIEVLPNQKFLAAWFTFDPAGTQQAWFMGIGTYTGNTATVTPVTQPVGGRWIPNFDPAAVVNRDWGTLTFTFTDCDHGRVDFSSTVPGYGSGSMNLTRLTQPDGLACP